MSDKPKTAAEWLALGDELPVELAKALTPGPWKHKAQFGFACDHHYCKCSKCGEEWHSQDAPQTPCPVPDDIVLDWNTAMEWRDWITCKITPTVADEIFCEISKIENRCFVYGAEPKKWWLWNAQPKHYLIAAALAEGAKK